MQVRKPQKLVVSDYKLLGEKGLWELVKNLRLEDVGVADFDMLTLQTVP